MYIPIWALVLMAIFYFVTNWFNSKESNRLKQYHSDLDDKRDRREKERETISECFLNIAKREAAFNSALIDYYSEYFKRYGALSLVKELESSSDDCIDSHVLRVLLNHINYSYPGESMGMNEISSNIITYDLDTLKDLENDYRKLVDYELSEESKERYESFKTTFHSSDKALGIMKGGVEKLTKMYNESYKKLF